MTDRPARLAFWLVVAATLLAAASRWFGLNQLPPQAWVDEIWFALRAREIVQTGEFPIFYKTFWGGVNPLLAWLTAAAQLAPFTEPLIASRVVSTTFAVLSVPLAYACLREFFRSSLTPTLSRRERESALTPLSDATLSQREREHSPSPFGKEGWGMRAFSPSPRGRGGRGMRAFSPSPFGREGRGVREPALAALLLTNFFFTVTLSRLGTEPAVALAAALFCVWQQKRGERAAYSPRTGAWLSFALAGLGAGLAQYLSPHARFILPLLALLGLHRLWLADSTQRRRLLLGYGLLAGVAVLAAAPLIAFFVQEPQWLLGRAQAVTVGAERGLAFYLDNARAIALSFSITGDSNPRDNLALRPLLDPLQSAGFVVGLIWLVLNLRHSPQARDLLLWLLVMALPSLLTDDAPSFSRMIGIAPPVAALIAVGWGQLWESVRPQLSARLAWLGACVWITFSLFFNGYDYFVAYARNPQMPPAFTVTAVNVARELSARAEAEPVFVERVLEAEADIYAFNFLFPGTRVERLDFRQCLPLADGRASRTTYLVWSERDAVTAPELLRLYPNAATQLIRGEPEALYRELTQIELPAGASFSAPPQRAAARFAPGLSLFGYEQSTPTARPGESVLFTFYWKAEAPLTEEATPFLHVGSGLADSAFVVGRDGQPCQGFYPTSRWRAGDVVPDRFAVLIPPDAVPGTYPLVVGWYRYPSLNRLALESADSPLADNRAIVGQLTITP